MSAKEMRVWLSVVEREEEMFRERSKGLPRLHRSKTSGCGRDEVESDVNKGGGGVSSDGRQAINNLMSLYEELGSRGDGNQILKDGRERKELDASVESPSHQDLRGLTNPDAIVPVEFSYATKPFRFSRREPKESRVDDEMKQMEMRHCLQLQRVEMKKKMEKAPKRMSQSVKQRQIDMNQNMQQSLRMQQLLSYQDRAHDQLAYNQIKMNRKNLEPYVDPTGNVEFLRLQNQNNNMMIQNLQQDQLAEISSGNHSRNQSQRHFPSAGNFLGSCDNSMQARNAGSAENQNMSTEMGYEFDELELDHLIASADAFMHDM